MLKIYLIAGVGLLFFCVSASAQKVNTDSLKLVARISEDQLKLGKLQNSVEGRRREKQDAANQAQNSADANITAAEKLSNEPEDKKLARNANSKAGDAKTDARKARKDASRLDDLNKNIQSLQGKIAGEQQRLDKYIPASITTSAKPLIPMQLDSIPRQ